MRLLMLEGLAGDGASYRLLLDELSRHLQRYFLRRLHGGLAADADDLVQETLMAVHSKRATYEQDRPFTPWAHAIARYKLLDYLRQRRVRPTVSLDDAGELFADDTVEATAARMDVERLLDTLPPRTGTLIRKVKIEGGSVAEAASANGMSESAVKVGIHRGMKALALRVRERWQREHE
ncbi:sigma-70 family RNA polymerase sigma factor [Marinivivus vitaminiproducens]|uniref:sigma-70 family RNA polymerase sigma factor n=1 Tax=Marinivivus vitaminiproducens TaxID=3035935 RepID=UPI00279C56F6|nr:sigma-70 family RNA polymerase sigma factor [Geminicoccaceae bacterium SCSIO 64248]